MMEGDELPWVALQRQAANDHAQYQKSQEQALAVCKDYYQDCLSKLRVEHAEALSTYKERCKHLQESLDARGLEVQGLKDKVRTMGRQLHRLTQSLGEAVEGKGKGKGGAEGREQTSPPGVQKKCASPPDPREHSNREGRSAVEGSAAMARAVSTSVGSLEDPPTTVVTSVAQRRRRARPANKRPSRSKPKEAPTAQAAEAMDAAEDDRKGSAVSPPRSPATRSQARKAALASKDASADRCRSRTGGGMRQTKLKLSSRTGDSAPQVASSGVRTTGGLKRLRRSQKAATPGFERKRKRILDMTPEQPPAASPRARQDKNATNPFSFKDSMDLDNESAGHGEDGRAAAGVGSSRRGGQAQDDSEERPSSPVLGSKARRGSSHHKGALPPMPIDCTLVTDRCLVLGDAEPSPDLYLAAVVSSSQDQSQASVELGSEGAYPPEDDGAPDASSSLESSFQAFQAARKERERRPAKPYLEVVRNKEARARLLAEACPECSKWWASDKTLTEEERYKRLQECGRHRVTAPTPREPSQLFEVDFPETQNDPRQQHLNNVPRRKKKVQVVRDYLDTEALGSIEVSQPMPETQMPQRTAWLSKAM